MDEASVLDLSDGMLLAIDSALVLADGGGRGEPADGSAPTSGHEEEKAAHHGRGGALRLWCGLWSPQDLLIPFPFLRTFLEATITTNREEELQNQIVTFCDLNILLHTFLMGVVASMLGLEFDTEEDPFDRWYVVAVVGTCVIAMYVVICDVSLRLIVGALGIVNVQAGALALAPLLTFAEWLCIIFYTCAEACICGAAYVLTRDWLLAVICGGLCVGTNVLVMVPTNHMARLLYYSGALDDHTPVPLAPRDAGPAGAGPGGAAAVAYRRFAHAAASRLAASGKRAEVYRLNYDR